MKVSILIRLTILCLAASLTACAAAPAAVVSKKVNVPAAKIDSLVLWHKQYLEEDNSVTGNYMKELVASLEKGLGERNIVVKPITTQRLGLVTPEEEVNGYIRRVKVDNLLKIYVARVSNTTSSGGAFTIFTIESELMNVTNQRVLWKASIIDSKTFIPFVFNHSPESTAAKLLEKLQMDGVLK